MATQRQFTPRQPSEFEEKVLQIRRVSRKTKGGNRISFTALVIVGDKKGRVGVGLGKGLDVQNAVRKGVRLAQRDMVNVPLRGDTIPHEIKEKFGAARVYLKPAPQGSGVIAGGSVRAVVELAGIRNIVGKIMGNNNKMSNVYATLNALRSIEQLAGKHSQLKTTKQK
jgi:small subunit ribosomal protein S5